MRKLAVLFVSVLLLVGALVWRAPATLVASRVSHLSDGRITLNETLGTVWHGHGVLAAGDARIPLEWKLQAMPLLHGELAIAMTPAPGIFGSTTPHGNITLTRRSVRLHDFAAGIPAMAIAATSVARPRLDAGGTIDFSTQDLFWQPPSSSGVLSTQWSNAKFGLAGGELVALGDVSALFTASGSALAGPIRNVGGEFSIVGDVLVRDDGGGRVHMTLQSRSPFDARMAMLALLGARQGDAVVIDWQWPAQ